MLKCYDFRISLSWSISCSFLGFSDDGRYPLYSISSWWIEWCISSIRCWRRLISSVSARLLFWTGIFYSCCIRFELRSSIRSSRPTIIDYWYIYFAVRVPQAKPSISWAGHSGFTESVVRSGTWVSSWHWFLQGPGTYHWSSGHLSTLARADYWLSWDLLSPSPAVIPTMNWAAPQISASQASAFIHWVSDSTP
jgi:hypothetical protein